MTTTPHSPEARRSRRVKEVAPGTPRRRPPRHGRSARPRGLRASSSWVRVRVRGRVRVRVRVRDRVRVRVRARVRVRVRASCGGVW